MHLHEYTYTEACIQSVQESSSKDGVCHKSTEKNEQVD